jgi:DNA-binding transcriptional regulator GbsR (MarR family)
MRNLKLQHNELPEENQICNLYKLKVYEELEKEEEMLFQEKKDLMEAEKQLWRRFSDAIEDKKQRNKELKQEVELLRRKCEEITAVLNRSNLPALSQQLNKDIEKLETNNKTAKEAISKLLIKKNDLEAELKELV